ncbi:trehalose-6-phosphate synthase [Dermatophilaceae bacterium Sec6.4]
MSDTTFDFVIAANRLPVDRKVDDEGNESWERSPGGLVTAMESVMRGREGAAWIGWAGDTDSEPDPFEDDGMYLVPLGLTQDEYVNYYEGFSNDTLWPLYHDVIVPATFRRRWRSAYDRVNERFAQRIADVASQGATVWVHDYQLQLVPALLRELRPDVRIGWFDHIPFPPVELFMQLPGREEILRGLLGADFLGFQRGGDAQNFLRACDRLLDVRVEGDLVQHGEGQTTRAAAVPISVDSAALRELALSDSVQERAKQIRVDLGNPKKLLIGVDRLDYTKGIRHRLKAYSELLNDGSIDPAEVTLVQVATPSRERLEAYRTLRGQVEQVVGRINGEHSPIGSPAVTYIHRSFDREEMVALLVAADVALVTPLRDGMNLVAKEYVMCGPDDGALVLSEFTGAAIELGEGSFPCNPHDIRNLKRTILEALGASREELEPRMRHLREVVLAADVQHWAADFLAALQAAPERPGP